MLAQVVVANVIMLEVVANVLVLVANVLALEVAVVANVLALELVAGVLAPEGHLKILIYCTRIFNTRTARPSEFLLTVLD